MLTCMVALRAKMAGILGIALAFVIGSLAMICALLFLVMDLANMTVQSMGRLQVLGHLGQDCIAYLGRKSKRVISLFGSVIWALPLVILIWSVLSIPVKGQQKLPLMGMVTDHYSSTADSNGKRIVRNWAGSCSHWRNLDIWRTKRIFAAKSFAKYHPGKARVFEPIRIRFDSGRYK